VCSHLGTEHEKLYVRFLRFFLKIEKMTFTFFICCARFVEHCMQVPHLHRHARRLLHRQHGHVAQLESAYSEDPRPVARPQNVLLQVPGRAVEDATTRRHSAQPASTGPGHYRGHSLT